ncbi:MAG: hypothetical protein ACLFTK_08135 [Anaerolineales bacterium]
MSDPQVARFLVLGAPGAGVTTFITTLGGLDAPADEATLPINDVLTIHLLGGQHPDPIPQTVVGIIYILDATQAEQLAEVWPHVQALPRVPTIIAVNRYEHITPDPLRTVRDALPENTTLKVFPCQAHDRQSTENILLALIYQMLSSR